MNIFRIIGVILVINWIKAQNDNLINFKFQFINKKCKSCCTLRARCCCCDCFAFAAGDDDDGAALITIMEVPNAGSSRVC